MVHGGVAFCEKVRPGILPEDERRALSQDLYKVHAAVFDGVSEEEFSAYVVSSPAADTSLLLYRNRDHDLIGYHGVHRFERSLDGRSVVVFRSEAGVLPGYRQKAAPMSFLLREATGYRLLHPWRRVYFLCAPVNPSSYAVVARYGHTVYTRYDESTPPETLRVMTTLAEELDLPQVGPNPLVRKVGWVTRATDREREYWRSTTNPHVRYYIDNNPGFGEGNGLLTVVPITLTNGMLSLLGYGRRRVRHELTAWRKARAASR